jgi:putative ABC transport system permease protein
MGLTLLRYKLKSIFKFRFQMVANLIGLTVALIVFITISHIAVFELSFDKYHNDYKNIYRLQNNRIYQNLNDESAGCPPGTGPAVKEEISEILESARIKPLASSILEFNKGDQKTQYYHDNLFYADNSVFKVFTFNFVSGNPEEALKEINTAVVTKTFGRKYFGTENVLGQTFKCSGNDGIAEYTISGVIDDIPANSYLNFDCLLSYETLISQNNDAAFGWGWNAFNTFVKLKPDSDIGSVNTKLEGIVSRYKLSDSEGMKRIFKLQPLESIHLHSRLRHEIGQLGNVFTIYVLTSIAIFILLIAWINYINISTAKSRKQITEISVRKVIGLTKGQIYFEHVFEALLIDGTSFLVSVIIIKVMSPLYKNLWNIELHPIHFSNWVAITCFSFLVSIISGLYTAYAVFGRKLTMQTMYDKINSKHLFRNGLVVFQFTVSIIFIIGAAFILKQKNYMELQQKRMAIDHVVVLKSLPNNKVLSAQEPFINEIKNYPGIKSVSISNNIPGGKFSNVIGLVHPISVKAEDGIKCYFLDIDENYFDLYHIELISGNNFTSNNYGKREFVLINAKAAKMFGYASPSEAINQKLVLGEMDNQTRTIIGVTEDYHQKSLQEPIEPCIFNYIKSGDYISVKYDPQLSTTIIGLLKEPWGKMFPDQPFDYVFNDQFYSEQYESNKVFGRLVCTFALLIVLIACIGLYSLARFEINKRVKEIGVRKVNGATISEVMALLNKDFVKWVIISFIIATPVAWYAINKWLENFAYKTNLSWWIFALSGTLALGIALFTVSWQSWRAATRNPVEALRYE